MEKSELKSFKRFLVDRGSTLLPLTNEYEILRFTCPQGIGIIYQNKTGRISHLTSPAHIAYDAFRRTSPEVEKWRVTEKTRRKPRSMSERERIRFVLSERDGKNCIYCGTALAIETQTSSPCATIDHVVPLTHGGPDRLENMVLACEKCNLQVGSMSVGEKMLHMLYKRKL